MPKVFVTTVSITNMMDPQVAATPRYAVILQSALEKLDHIDEIVVDGRGIFRIFTARLTSSQHQKMTEEVNSTMLQLFASRALGPHQRHLKHGAPRLSFSQPAAHK